MRDRTEYSTAKVPFVLERSSRRHPKCAITRDYTNGGWIIQGGAKPKESKKFIFTPNLWNMVPFLHLLVAIDNVYTPNKFGLRRPKRRSQIPCHVIGSFCAPILVAVGVFQCACLFMSLFGFFCPYVCLSACLPVCLSTRMPFFVSGGMSLWHSASDTYPPIPKSLEKSTCVKTLRRISARMEVLIHFGIQHRLGFIELLVSHAAFTS